MATTSDPDIITLNCIIPGDLEEDIITLEISKYKQVNALKPMIKKWWAYRFHRIDPSKFVLYKYTTTSEETIEKQISTLSLNGKIGDYLYPLDEISFHFNERTGSLKRRGDPDQAERDIHILIYPDTEAIK